MKDLLKRLLGGKDGLPVVVSGPSDFAEIFASSTSGLRGLSSVARVKVDSVSAAKNDWLTYTSLAFTIYGATLTPVIPSIYNAFKKSNSSWIEIKTPTGSFKVSRDDFESETDLADYIARRLKE